MATQWPPTSGRHWADFRASALQNRLMTHLGLKWYRIMKVVGIIRVHQLFWRSWLALWLWVMSTRWACSFAATASSPFVENADPYSALLLLNRAANLFLLIKGKYQPPGAPGLIFTGKILGDHFGCRRSGQWERLEAILGKSPCFTEGSQVQREVIGPKPPTPPGNEVGLESRDDGERGRTKKGPLTNHRVPLSHCCNCPLWHLQWRGRYVSCHMH